MIINIDHDGNILIGSDTASTTAVQFMLFLLSQLKGSQFASFDYGPNSAYKNIEYDPETHVLSWEKWGQQETYSMTTTDLQAYAAQCITQVTVDYATHEQVAEIKALVQALPGSDAFVPLATSSQLEPLAKSSELDALAKSADLDGLAQSSELGDLAQKADVDRIEKLLVQARNRATISAIGSAVSTGAALVAASAKSQTTSSTKSDQNFEIKEDL
jgi:hypothetical protein